MRAALDGAGGRRVAARRRRALPRPELEHPGRVAGGVRRVDWLVERFEEAHERLYGTRLEEGSPVDVRALRLIALGAGAAARSRSRTTSPRAAGDAPRRLRAAPRHARGAGAAAARDLAGAGARAAADRRVRHDRRRAAGLDGRARRSRPARSCSRRSTSSRRPPRPMRRRSRCGSSRTRSRRRPTRWRRRSSAPRTPRSSATRWTTRPRSAGPTAETIAQAVTIPLQLGSIPQAMTTLLERFGGELRARRRLHRQRPLRRGEPHARHLRRQAVLPRRHAARLRGHDRAPRRRRRPRARLVRLRQHRGLPGGAPPAVAAALRARRAGRCACSRSSARTSASRTSCSATSPRRWPRATSATARCRSSRAGTAPRGSTALMGGLLDHTEALLRAEIASWPDGTVTFTDYLDSDGIDVCDVPITVDLTIRGSDARRRLLALGADGARRAQLHAVVRRGERLPHGHGRLGGRHPAHGRRAAPDHRPHEARDGHARRHAGCLVDARRHRLPSLGRDERRALADRPRARSRGRRGREHARVLHGTDTAASSGSTASSSSAPGAAARSPTATTASPTRARAWPTSRSRSPRPTGRS